MAISSSVSQLIDPRGAAPAGVHRPAAQAVSEAAGWGQAMLAQQRGPMRAGMNAGINAGARHSMRTDSTALIRAAQHVWLASQDRQTAAVSAQAQDAQVDIEAFISMLVEQASEARRGI